MNGWNDALQLTRSIKNMQKTSRTLEIQLFLKSRIVLHLLGMLQGNKAIIGKPNAAADRLFRVERRVHGFAAFLDVSGS